MGEGKRKTPNKRKQRKLCQAEMIHRIQESRHFTCLLIFSELLRRTCPMFRGSEATREEHLRSDWRIGARTLFRHKLGGGGGCSLFIYVVLQLGNQVPHFSGSPGCAEDNQCESQQWISAVQVGAVVFMSSKCRSSFSIWHCANVDWEMKGRGNEG